MAKSKINKFQKNDLSKVDYSSAGNDFNSLYGLSSGVEEAILLTINKKN